MTSRRQQAQRWLLSERHALALETTTAHLAARPDLVARYGTAGRSRCLEDAGHHIDQLAVSVGLDAPDLFMGYLRWVKTLLAGYGVPPDDLVEQLGYLAEAIATEAPSPLRDLIHGQVDRGRETLGELSSEAPTELPSDGAHSPLARQYLSLVLAKRRREALDLIARAAEAGVDVREIYLEVFGPVQREIGRLWQENKITVADEHFATAVTQVAMSSLYPRIFAAPRCGMVMVATCTEGDLHEIGVRMVADFFEMEGWDTIYLGASVPSRAVVATVAETKPNLVLASTTMTKHLPALASLIELLRAEPDTRDIPVLVGGPPFLVDPKLAARIGATGVAADAIEAVKVGRELAETHR